MVEVGEDDHITRARAGEGAALGALLELHRPRLLRMVRIRLHAALRRRADPDDVVQETFLDATRRFAEFSDPAPVPFYVWLRALCMQRIADIHRRHLGAQARDPRREAAAPLLADSTSAALAEQLVGSMTSPSRAAARAEMRDRVRTLIERLEPMDREVLALRHFEQLSNAETAGALGIATSAASKRYVRALVRLREVLVAGGEGEEVSR